MARRHALLCVLAALTCAPGVLRAQADGAQAEARTAYTSGVEAYGSADYERARKQFSVAESRFPSPNIELMLGRSLARLERLLEAHRMLTQARDNAGQVPKYAAAATAARDELSELEKRLAVLHVRVIAPHGDETLLINGERMAPIAWASPMVVSSGKVRLELSRPGVPAEVKELVVTPGGSASLELRLAAVDTLEPAAIAAPPGARAEARAPAVQETPQPGAESALAAPAGGRGRQLRGFSYALAGVGVVGLGTFAVLGAMSHGQFSQLEAGCPDASRCDPRLRDNATRGQTYQTLANVALVAGAAALTTGVTLWLVSLPEERAQVAITASSVQLSGSF